jgi:predicted nucleic-acid-binding Zn-ribbon protein
MPRWVLGCPKCHNDFTHSEIAAVHDSSFADFIDWLGAKPDFPIAGLSVECPNCKKTTIYKRQQLVFRAS